MHRHLLEQASRLASSESAGAPRQADLRRAVSTAYYALFRFLVEESCRATLGKKHAQRPFRDALARAYAHTTMKNACKSFGSANLPDSVAKPLPKNMADRYEIRPEIKDIATIFGELQTIRNLADYDPSERFFRSKVRLLIQQTRIAIENFAKAGQSDDRQFFLVCLLAWKEMSGR